MATHVAPLAARQDCLRLAGHVDADVLVSEPSTNVVSALTEAFEDRPSRLLTTGLDAARVALVLKTEHASRLLRRASSTQRCTSSTLSRRPLATQLCRQGINLGSDRRLAAMQVRNQLRPRCPLHEPVASGTSRSRIPRAASTLHDVRHEIGRASCRERVKR